MNLRAIKIALALMPALLLCCAGTSHRYQPARVADKRPLNYPLSAQLEKIEGKVELGVFVDAEGAPVNVRVLESSGHAVLDTAAYQFAKTLTFRPAVIDDNPISTWTKLVLQYRLTDVVFEKNKWIRDVLYLQQHIEAEKDGAKRAEYQRRLYIQYIGFFDYAKKMADIDLNYAIKTVVQKSTIQNWGEIWQEIVVTFALFEDFLTQYPDSNIREQVRADLIRALIDAESEIRTKALRSRKTALRAADLIDLIEARLKELQPKVPQS